MKDTEKFSLDGKTILITGGAGYLGQLFGKALARAGGNIVLGDVRLKEVEQAGKEIASETKGTAIGIELDVTDRATIATAVRTTVEKFGRLDVVINNAGLDPKFDAHTPANNMLFENYPEEFIRRSLDVNLLGATLVAQRAVEHMLKQESGNIINISSLYGMHGPDQRIYPKGTQKPVDYSISKGGLVMLTKWLATSYAARGIRANTLTLGGVFNNHPDEFREKYGNRVPDGKMVGPDEVGGSIIYLASDASAALNGHNLVLDHGFSAW